MENDSMDLARARMAIHHAARRHFSDPNLSMIDFGFPREGQKSIENKLAIRFHVRKKYSPIQLESAIEFGYTNADFREPIRIGGYWFDTDVIEGAYYHHQFLGNGRLIQPVQNNPRARRNDPLVGGISISDENHNGFGTLGGIVRDRFTGAAMILSNWHVLVADWRARAGQRIYQPGRLDGGRADDAVAQLTRDAMSVNLDAAVASLTGARRALNQQFGIPMPVTGVGQPKFGMKVIKSGRRTDVTIGTVDSVEGVAPRMRYGPLERTIVKVLTIKPLPGQAHKQVSDAGDSGSWWLDAESGKVVGLHFAGQNFPEELALAIDMPTILNALNIDIVMSGT